MGADASVRPDHDQPEIDGALWAAVDRLMDRAPRLSDLRSHRVELLALRRWRSLGLPVPEELLEEERRAAVPILTAPLVLERVRAVLDGPVLLLKGHEVAARYPDPVMRPFADVDLLVPDAGLAHRSLVAAGFRPVGDPAVYIDIHHLRPLALRGLPLPVEIHFRPKWIAHRCAPSAEDLLEQAVPAAVGVDGVLAPCPRHHTLLLAAHSWAHEPLRRLRDLVDIAALSQGVDRAELQLQAEAWDIARLWRTTAAAVDALILDSSLPWALRIWARNLPKVRERTVLENHLERWLSNSWALSGRESAGLLVRTLAREVKPESGETWQEKLARTGRALANALRRRSEHEATLERDRPAARAQR
jgi:Uncharacterised nucleotidyltransferase